MVQAAQLYVIGLVCSVVIIVFELVAAASPTGNWFAGIKKSGFGWAKFNIDGNVQDYSSRNVNDAGDFCIAMTILTALIFLVVIILIITRLMRRTGGRVGIAIVVLGWIGTFMSLLSWTIFSATIYNTFEGISPRYANVLSAFSTFIALVTCLVLTCAKVRGEEELTVDDKYLAGRDSVNPINTPSSV